MKIDGRLFIVFIMVLGLIPGACATISVSGGTSVSTSNGESYGLTTVNNNGATGFSASDGNLLKLTDNTLLDFGDKTVASHACADKDGLDPTVTISDTKGDSASVIWNFNWNPSVRTSTWNYAWNTYTQYGGVGAHIHLNAANVYSFQGGSYGSNYEGDTASVMSSGSSPSGVLGASVTNEDTYTNSYPADVYSRLTADRGVGASTICFDATSRNREGEYAYQYLDGYGTSSKPATINYPAIYADSIKNLAQVGASTTGASGTSAILYTHVENLAPMIGHEGKYNSAGGDFGVNDKNYVTLTGSVSGLAYGAFYPNAAYANNVFLYPSVNKPSYETAYLLDPFRREQAVKDGQSDWGYNALNALMNDGQAVTYYRDAAVTRSRVGDMGKYYVSVIKTHMNPNAIEISRAAETNRFISGSDLASMFTQNPQGLIMLGGCSSFYPSATSPLANAVKNKEWLSGGYNYDVDSAGNSLFMTDFFNYLSQGNSARTAATKSSNAVFNALHVTVSPTWTPSNHDFYLL